jgi:3-dehydroquinate dehydratase/shikimate dehydrogenase
MTHLTVPIMVDSLDTALAAAARAAEHGADLVEYRIDRFTDDTEAIGELVGRSPLPCVVTCRPEWEGGEYEGEEARRVECLEAAAARQPAYIDIELAAYQTPEIHERVKAMVDHPGQVGRTTTGLILSAHDFDGRPADLFQKLEAMVSSSACRVIKLAWRARSLRDNLEAFELVSAQHKPTIALCMGQFGLPSRLLAPKFGALLSFAALDADQATAPGQATVEEMKQLYRWDALNSATSVYGVIGWPVAHSMSPAIHNAGFAETGENAVYLPLPIPPEYEHFKATVGSWLDADGLDFRGASVTIPHKENLIRFVVEQGGQVEPLAERIGAANTLSRLPDGRLHASNTDYAAALDSVCVALGVEWSGLADRRVAVIGAGGVARAAVAGFAAQGATVVVYNRTVERAQALAEQFDRVEGGGKVVAAPLANLCKSCAQVYINCTSVGMSPETDQTPMPEPPEALGEGAVVFDTIYNPPRTRLLAEAEAAGAKTVGGVEMFVRQGAVQFERWTGRAAPLELFERVMREKLGSA